MARGDRTGPEGRGPRTGRGSGYCAGNDRPGYQTDGPPAGRGYGRGFGRGRGRGFRRGGGYADPGDRFAAEAGPNSGLAAEVARQREQVQALVDRLSRSGD